MGIDLSLFILKNNTKNYACWLVSKHGLEFASPNQQLPSCTQQDQGRPILIRAA